MVINSCENCVRACLHECELKMFWFWSQRGTRELTKTRISRVLKYANTRINAVVLYMLFLHIQITRKIKYFNEMRDGNIYIILSKYPTGYIMYTIRSERYWARRDYSSRRNHFRAGMHLRGLRRLIKFAANSYISSFLQH